MSKWATDSSSWILKSVRFNSIYKLLQKMKDVCSDLAELVRSRERWLWDIATKRNVFLLFSIVLSILQLITLEPLVRFRWGFQQNVPLLMRALQSNRKLKMSHVRLQTDVPRSHHIFSFKACTSGISSSSVSAKTFIKFVVYFKSKDIRWWFSSFAFLHWQWLIWSTT